LGTVLSLLFDVISTEGVAVPDGGIGFALMNGGDGDGGRFVKAHL